MPNPRPSVNPQFGAFLESKRFSIFFVALFNQTCHILGMKENLDKTVKVLKDATMSIRADYLARYIEMEMALLIKDRAGLAAVGMDAQIYAPFPNGSMSRAAYHQGQAKHARVRASFQGVKSCRSMKDPEIVVEKPEAEARRHEIAKQEADALVDSYLFKLAGKIGKEITACTTNGQIWEYATLKVTCADGEEQTWVTNCILNRSIYNKIFNQWPTRRTA